MYDIIKASYKIGVENGRCRKCPVLKCCQKVADVELKVNQKLFGYFCMKSVDPFNQHQPFLVSKWSFNSGQNIGHIGLRPMVSALSNSCNGSSSI